MKNSPFWTGVPGRLFHARRISKGRSCRRWPSWPGVGQRRWQVKCRSPRSLRAAPQRGRARFRRLPSHPVTRRAMRCLPLPGLCSRVISTVCPRSSSNTQSAAWQSQTRVDAVGQVQHAEIIGDFAGFIGKMPSPAPARDFCLQLRVHQHMVLKQRIHLPSLNAGAAGQTVCSCSGAVVFSLWRARLRRGGLGGALRTMPTKPPAISASNRPAKLPPNRSAGSSPRPSSEALARVAGQPAYGRKLQTRCPGPKTKARAAASRAAKADYA